MSFDVSMDKYVIYTYHGVLCVCVSSVTQLCLILWDPTDCSSPSLPELHSLQEFSQTHVHWVSDAIQPSCPLLPLFPPALNLSFLASGSFPRSRLFTSGGPSIGVRFSISPSNKYSGLISFRLDWLDLLLSKGLSRVSSKTTVRNHHFFSTQSSLWSNSDTHTWWLGKP